LIFKVFPSRISIALLLDHDVDASEEIDPEIVDKYPYYNFLENLYPKYDQKHISPHDIE
jgi:hypothetical protein